MTETTETGGQPEETSQSGTDRLSEMLEAMSGELKKLKTQNKDIFGRLAALREGREFSPDGKPSDLSVKQKPGLTEEDLAAAVRLGSLKTGLSSEAQDHLEEMQANGRSFRDLVEFAEFAHKAGVGGKSNSTPKRNSGRAEMAAQSTASPMVTTAEEWLELRKDKKRYEAFLKQNPDFDPRLLFRGAV